MAERKMFSVVSKTLLKNVIRHTDAHNKVVEEEDMWRQHRKHKEHKEPVLRERENSFLKDRGADMRHEFSSHRERRAHMDDEPSSTYWMKKLYKAEEQDKDRWGHSGFKELYPEKFHASDSSSSDESARKYHSSKREKRVERTRKRRRSDSETSDSDEERSDERHSKKRKKKHKHKDKNKKKKKKHKKRRHREDSESS